MSRYIIYFSIVFISYVICIDLNSIANLIKEYSIDFKDHHKDYWNDFTVPGYFHDQFKNDAYKNFTGNDAIYVGVMEVKELGFGNNFGNYFEMLSTAKLIGAHFIGIWKNPSSSKYLDKLHTTYIHPNHVSKYDAIATMKRLPLATQFPWQQYTPRAAWSTNINTLDDILSSFLHPYLQDEYNTNDVHQINISLSKFSESNIILQRELKPILTDKHDILSLVMNHDKLSKYFKYNNSDIHHISSLPLIPDAAISIRCNDILHHHSDFSPYGFINFNVYLMLIPRGVRYIYILTEPSSYNSGSNYYACEVLIASLISFLHVHYHNATIPVMRGHQYDAMIILQQTNIAICTASTFCFWPMLTNTHSSYFPATWLIANAVEHMMTDRFHWINYPKLHSFGYDMMKDSKDKEKLAHVLHSLISIPDGNYH